MSSRWNQMRAKEATDYLSLMLDSSYSSSTEDLDTSNDCLDQYVSPVRHSPIADTTLSANEEQDNLTPGSAVSTCELNDSFEYEKFMLFILNR